MNKKMRWAVGILLVLLIAACTKQKDSGSKWIYAATRPQIFQSNSPVVGGDAYFVVFPKNETVFYSVWTSQQTGIPGTDNSGNLYYGDTIGIASLNVPAKFITTVDSALNVSTKGYLVVSEFVDGGAQNVVWNTTNY